MDYKKLHSSFASYKESSLTGRYITLEMLESILKEKPYFRLETLGSSVLGKPIYGLKLGNGQRKVLAWSQMHGNESTTTKAVMDLLNFFEKEPQHELLSSITLYIIPMLNPDGAAAYTRLNANEIDLNRDAQQLSQPESRILRDVYLDYQPDFCLNLHGQRTIFGVGKTPKSASMSFLSPAQDKDRKTTPSRKMGMSVISSINEMLQEFIPGGVGRYDDGFNINCVGDTLQAKGIPTLLFEAGHLDGDYEREQVRALVFLSLLKALEHISSLSEKVGPTARYFKIPENKKCFYDHILCNIKLSEKGTVDIAVQYREELVDGAVHFTPIIERIGDLSAFKGHKEWNCEAQKVVSPDAKKLTIGAEIAKLTLSMGQTITFALNLPFSL